MHFRAIDIARAVDGELVGADVDVDGATIDSRAATHGQLFVPVVAERDGHDFVAEAVAAGATAYLTSRGRIEGAAAASAIEVDDTGLALRGLGRLARDRLTDRVVGVTGSVGKTSVKDLTTAALAAGLSVHSSARSFNNELGVPLTLANSPDDVESVVIEMGARGVRHIADLCEIARPTVGVVTAVVLAHAEMFGTIDDVAVAKGELVESLPADGTAVLNGDDPLVAAMSSRTQARVLTFGVDAHRRDGHSVDVTASGVTIDAHLRPSFRLESPWGRAHVALPVHGAHQVINALAAASAALVCGVDVAAVASGLSNAELSPWRMELQHAPSGALILNDAYNANPTSMEAALRALASLPAERRVAVVGVMAELGAPGPAEHRRIGALARDLGIVLIAVATADYGDVEVTVASDIDGAFTALGRLGAGDAVLVKGSRVAGLERLAALLLA